MSLAKLDVSEWCEKVEIAGAGFLNFRLKTSAMAQTLAIRRARRTSVFCEGRDTAHDRHRLQFAERRQADARRPHPLDDPRRLPRARAALARPSRHHRQPHRRLGHAVRHVARRLEDSISIALRSKRDPIAEMERLYKTVSAACKDDPAALERRAPGTGEAPGRRRGKPRASGAR